MSVLIAVTRTFLEKILRWSIHPRLRGRLLALLGAEIGKNARINEVLLVNLMNGFRNLSVGRDSYIGPGCLIDLTARVRIGERSAVSPHCTLLTHADPGSSFGNRLASAYPKKIKDIRIGDNSWIGAGAIILCGVTIGSGSVVGAGSLVNKDVPDSTLVCGNPARFVRRIEHG